MVKTMGDTINKYTILIWSTAPTPTVNIKGSGCIQVLDRHACKLFFEKKHFLPENIFLGPGGLPVLKLCPLQKAYSHMSPGETQTPRNTCVHTRHPTNVTATCGVMTWLPAKLSKNGMRVKTSADRRLKNKLRV